jgi:hypothetical protein
LPIYSTIYPFIFPVGYTSLVLLATLSLPTTLPDCKKPTPVRGGRGEP